MGWVGLRIIDEGRDGRRLRYEALRYEIMVTWLK